MKLRKLALVPIAAAIMGFGTPAVANSLELQGVTFNTFVVDSDTLRLSILNATHATGDWLGINFLRAFEIKDIGAITSATIISGPGWSSDSSSNSWTTMVSNELNASGCGIGNSSSACFSASPVVTLTDTMIWDIDFTVPTDTHLNFDAPVLKVNFLTGEFDANKTGSNLSMPIPEPEIYAMLAAGLGLMGFVARRRRQSLESASA